jgi:secreted PhoX family phosphatase
MSNSTPESTRRRLLQLFAGAPMLPLAGLTGVSTLLSACGGSDDPAPVTPPTGPTTPTTVTFTTVEITGMAAPTAADVNALATTTVGSSLKVNFSDGSSNTYKLAYQPFYLTGDKVPDGKGGTVIAGGYVDIKNQPIIDKSVPGQERQFFSDSPDGTSLLTVPNANVAGVKGKPVFAVVQFEYNTADQAGGSTYGTLPSPIAVLTLDQDQTTGKLSLVQYHNVDTSAVKGLWITCGASLSPWGTHLSSEEYEPDAFDQGLGGQSLAVLKAYSQNVFGNPGTANPYDYGHLPEVTVNPDGTGTIRKHYNLGRYSRELVQVMPDQRTVLGGDDYTNGGLFMFVADKAGDLTAGTLYVAKYTTQLTETTTGKVQWIKLGHATHAEIKALVDGGIKPTDIMDSTKTDPADASYTKITLQKTNAWVRVKAGQEKAAAFLETHRYAALKGASMSFTKNEGTTVNIKDKIAYSAYANIQDSMVEGGSGYVAANNVKFKKLVAGGVMQHKLAGGQKDDTGAAIDSEWVITESSLLIAGVDIAADGLGNTADPAKIASPDNLKFSEKLRTLFIGEDSGNHLNNFLWAYNVDTQKLARLLSCPAGAESTGLHAVDEINGFTYVMSNFQHAGDEWQRFPALPAALKDQINTVINTKYNNKASSAVGYLTGELTQVKLSK